MLLLELILGVSIFNYLLKYFRASIVKNNYFFKFIIYIIYNLAKVYVITKLSYNTVLN